MATSTTDGSTPGVRRHRRWTLFAVAACLALVGVAALALRDDGRADAPVADTVHTVVGQPAESAGSTPAPTDVVDSVPLRCGDIPLPTLVGADGAAVDMDLVFFGDSCGFDADGEARFDDAYRPRSVLPVDGAVTLTNIGDAVTLVDIRALDAGLVLHSIEPTVAAPAPFARSDEGDVFELDGLPCAVVTVARRSETSNGRFVALAESQPGACVDVDVAVADPSG